MSAPSKEEIARVVGVAREEAPLIHLESYTAVASVIAHLADENKRLRALAEKQRALISEQDADHAKLRAERAELRALFPDTIAAPDDDCAEEDDPTCAKCGFLVHVDEGCEWVRGDVCHHCAQEAFDKPRALLRGRRP